MTFEESDNSKFPLVVWRTKDYGIIEWVIIEPSSPEKLSYLIPKPHETKVVSVFKTYHPDVLDCEWSRDRSLLNHLKITLGPVQKLDNDDVIQHCEDLAGLYFCALVSRA